MLLKKIHIPLYVNNNSEQSDLAGFLWYLNSGCWILLFLGSFLPVSVVFLHAEALHIVTLPASRPLPQDLQNDLPAHAFLGDCSIAAWKKGSETLTLIPGPEQGAFYESLQPVSMLNTKNWMGSVHASMWPGVFRGTAGRAQEGCCNPGHGELCSYPSVLNSPDAALRCPDHIAHRRSAPITSSLGRVSGLCVAPGMWCSRTGGKQSRAGVQCCVQVEKTSVLTFRTILYTKSMLFCKKKGCLWKQSTE